MYDIIVVGAGPAGMTAALYALRADKTVLLIEKENFGGQITFSPKVENYPTIQQISGNELAQRMLDQVIEHGAQVEMAEVIRIDNTATGKTVVTDYGTFEGRSVIIAVGSKHRMLNLEGEEDLVGEGVSYCAVCDGAFYAGQRVAVIGGGNTALQEAIMLSDICQHVTLIQNLGFMTGEKRLLSILEKKENVSMIYHSVVTKLNGTNKLESIEIRNTRTEACEVLSLDGVFVAIGQVPENKCFENVVSLNEQGYIIADESCLTPSSGIFVAGDCRTKAIRQVTTAAADGAVAALSACRYLDSLETN